MKCNVFQTILSVGISGIISFALGWFAKGDSAILLGVGSFITFVSSLTLSMGIELKNDVASTNVKVLSGIFFTVFLIANFVFMFINFSVPVYVIIMGILLLSYLSIVYGIGKSKQ